jgi:5'-nucleotidase
VLSSSPRAVVTNDDGVGTEGLWHLAAVAAEAGFDVVVAAPSGEASGTGSAIKATGTNGRVEVQHRELPAPAAGIAAYALDATPAFIVFAAMRGAFGPVPEFVLSGINRGPNTGKAILHSGTVGAALTAVGYGLTAAAFSLDNGPTGRLEWATAAQVAAQVLAVLPGVPGPVALNVNVPNLPAGRLRGIQQARLGSFGKVQSIGAAAEGHLQLGVYGTLDEPEPGSDSAVLAAGYASVTPVRAVCELPSDGLPWPAAPVTPS